MIDRHAPRYETPIPPSRSQATDSCSLAGKLADFDLPQIMAVLEAGRATGILEVRTPGRDGVLHLRRGDVVSATSGRLQGEAAAVEILSWPWGQFAFFKAEVNQPRSVDRSNQGLCLEAVRLLDESRAGDVTFARAAGLEIASCSELERLLLVAMPEPTSLNEIAARCHLSPAAALFALEQLQGRGAVRRCNGGGATPVAPDRVRVLLVDDSLLMQKALRHLYESDPGIEVVGVAGNGERALELLAELKPDVVSLDLYMPVMDGITTLKRIMLSQPTPTVIVTSAAADELDLTFESILRFGAIDFITKPSRNRGVAGGQADGIVDRLRNAARVNLRGVRMVQPAPRHSLKRAERTECRGLIAAYGGTGGCLSYMQFLTSLPTDVPLGVVGVLRFPADFLRAFVDYLSKSSTFTVELARDGAPIEGGVCYLAAESDGVGVEHGPAGPVLTVRRSEARTGPVGLFRDAAAVFRERSAGILLSGSDGDAIAGLASIRAAAGVTMVQLPETCVDPGQLHRAIELRLVDRIVLLAQISSDLSQALLARLRTADRARGESTPPPRDWVPTALAADPSDRPGRQGPPG